MNERSHLAPSEPAAGSFQTTHWSLVLRAGHREDREAETALATLCERYWYPLYVYVRRRVADVAEAQDLTQEFFAWLLEKNTLASACPERGRFRAFLLTALKNFLMNQWDRANAQKRGGGIRRLSLDLDDGESRLRLEPAHELTPERLYERQWVLTLLDLVMRRLCEEWIGGSNGVPFPSLWTLGQLVGRATDR
jgi:RNA polymerase sigma-70 factor (ECF subfamily)